MNANEIIEDNITILSTFNISEYELSVHDNARYITSLNVSQFTTLKKITKNVSGFTTTSNKTTLLSSLNVSGFTNLNNETGVKHHYIYIYIYMV